MKWFPFVSTGGEESEPTGGASRSWSDRWSDDDRTTEAVHESDASELTDAERWARDAIPDDAEGIVITSDGTPIRLVPSEEASKMVRASVDELLQMREELESDVRSTDR